MKNWISELKNISKLLINESFKTEIDKKNISKLLINESFKTEIDKKRGFSL